ncbi:MAG TPA: hypothetical protein VL501_06470 [Pyrinomonadaceae bacterium]|nr:hypothetical protein [Pyrinomonadaceae bacterium]
MMNTYTSNTSDIIRQDFLRFSAGTPTVRSRRRVNFEADAPAEPFTGSLDELRAEMANDDGQGSYASYKSIF